MNKEHLRVMLENGMHIGSHGYDHCWWNTLSKADQQFEIVSANKFLRGMGVDMRYLSVCYPYGAYNEETLKLLDVCGVKAAFTTKPDVAEIKQDCRYILPRLDTNDISKNANGIKDQWYFKA